MMQTFENWKKFFRDAMIKIKYEIFNASAAAATV